MADASDTPTLQAAGFIGKDMQWKPASSSTWSALELLWRNEGAGDASSEVAASSSDSAEIERAIELRHTALISNGLVSDRSGPKGWSMSGIYGEVDVHAAWDVLARAALLWRPKGDKTVAMANTRVGSGSLPPLALSPVPGKPGDETAVPTIPGGKFVDLGSGAGRVVLCAAAMGVFSECMGVEVDGPLHQCACAAAEASASILRSLRPSKGGEGCSEDGAAEAHTAGCGTSSSPPAAEPPPASALPYPDEWQPRGQWPMGLSAIRLVCGDLGSVDWSDASVVFVTATCFDEALLATLTARCERLRAGSMVVSMGRRLESPLLERLGSVLKRMDWGDGTMHVYRRARGGRWLAGVLKR